MIFDICLPIVVWTDYCVITSLFLCILLRCQWVLRILVQLEVWLMQVLFQEMCPVWCFRMPILQAFLLFANFPSDGWLCSCSFTRKIQWTKEFFGILELLAVAGRQYCQCILSSVFARRNPILFCNGNWLISRCKIAYITVCWNYFILRQCLGGIRAANSSVNLVLVICLVKDYILIAAWIRLIC